MDAAESQTILDPQPPQDNPKKLITLGKNDQVPLEEIWREADPACRFCHLGIQQVSGGPRRVCGCAVRNIMRRRHGQTPHAPLAKVVKSPAGEEHARAKLDRLRREAEKRRAEIERRQEGYDAGVDEAMDAATTEAEKLSQLEATLDAIARHMEVLEERQRQVRESIANMTEMHDETENKRREQEQVTAKAYDALAAVKARAQRRLDDMAGARARLEKLERRISIHRAAHPELEGEFKS